jgi:O-antigen/teichoic acid export membrane protein
MTGRFGGEGGGDAAYLSAQTIGIPIRATARRARSLVASGSRVIRKLRGAGWALADQCFISAANFLTIYLFARYLDATVFGAFILAYSGLLLLTSVQNGLLIVPHSVLGAPLPHSEYQRFTGALVLAQAAFAVVSGVLLAVAGMLVLYLYSPLAGGVLIALAVTVVPWMGQEFIRRVLYTRGESRSALINDSITHGLQLLGAIALTRFWLDRQSPETALFVLGGSSLIGVLIGAWQVRHHVRLGGRESRTAIARTWREVWHYGKWLTGQNAFVMFGSQAHAWIIGLLLGAEQLGIYRGVTHLTNVLNPLAQTFSNYFSPRGSRAYDAGGVAGLSRWVRRASWLLPLALLPICIVLIAFPGKVLALAYGDKFAGTTLALILALATIQQLIFFAKHPFVIGLLALRSTKAIFGAHVIAIALLLTLGATLIYLFGMVGIAVAGVVINSVLLGVIWLTYKKRLKIAKT